ncbi:hypothetical protein IV203_028162 [Nitzschia inconspicua]|uniref:SET domain-containing protein n=1 Tax=Nitzschia inconspicua TaxID=303405 RepID=A0A9K3KJZ8_9STRA|nr:hypothetical protein IV203_028186 [Nitzschia inconspicua]KAG7337025.1 hypothetical protein IV203_022789 [Nitzschia inconspicua]KAG7344686.1 hypothetical protein IV203_032217 [Nitzschia inconspicua]KAG7370416.1 hypothetical protein IV203_028162 [Nitzschia inconspicua]
MGKNDRNKKLDTYPFAQDCTNYNRVIHKEEVFSGILRDALKQSKLDLDQPVPKFLKRPFHNGMQIDYEVKDDPVHGRGLYAKEDLDEGTLVWDGDLASFTNIREFVAFLRYLPHELQCDVMLWAYPVKDSYQEVNLDMDEGSYMNDGGIHNSNVGGDTTMTLRDVKAGEHLAADYHGFLDFEGKVKWFHELREQVFGSGEYTEQGTPPQSSSKQNDYRTVLRADTTSTATASAIDYLFREMDALVEASNQWDMSSPKQLSVVVVTLSSLLTAALLLRRRIFSKNKVHGN